MGGYAISDQPNTTTVIDPDDLVRVYDASAGDERKLTVGNLLWKSVSAATTVGAQDGINVAGCSVVLCATPDNAVTIGGFTGGVAGQVLFVVHTDTTNDLVLEYNETGPDQKVFLQKEADQTISTYGGWRLVCDGTNWFEVRNTASL